MGKVIEIGSQGAQFRDAEKNDEGMALKIQTRAEDMTDGEKNPGRLNQYKIDSRRASWYS
jgi:hypothetical protein